MLGLQDTDDARPVHHRKRKRKGERRACYVSQRICAWELGRVGFGGHTHRHLLLLDGLGRWIVG